MRFATGRSQVVVRSHLAHSGAEKDVKRWGKGYSATASVTMPVSGTLKANNRRARASFRAAPAPRRPKIFAPLAKLNPNYRR